MDNKRMRFLRFALLASFSLSACDRAIERHSRPRTRPLSEQQAAKETYIDGLRLLAADAQEPRLTALDIHLGYVAQDTRPGKGKYLCGGMSSDESSSRGRIISAALARLPDASLKKLQLKYVILCSRAMADGQRIGGIPVPPLNLLMLDVGGTNDSTYLQHLFFHELYHLIEFRFKTFEDSDWQMQFGTGYANSYGGPTRQTAIGSGKRGFLNSYGETFPHEDRAELFASLLLNPAEIVAHINATYDDRLREKAQYVVEKCARLTRIAITVPGL